MSTREVYLSTHPSKFSNIQKFPEQRNYNLSTRIYNIDVMPTWEKGVDLPPNLVQTDTTVK
jgi:hypothetical protein